MSVVSISTNDPVAYPRTRLPNSPRCWTRASWADDWTLRPDLVPTESTWVAASAGESGTAELLYRYGRVLLPGANAYEDFAPITARGFYVLIEWPTDDGDPMYWLGFAESAITTDHHPARGGLPMSGLQTLPCFDLYRGLQESWVTSTIVDDPAGGVTPRRNESGAVFNRNQIGNRNATKRSIDDSDSAYAFNHPQDGGDFWSTRDIVEHLFAFHLPTPEQTKDDDSIPWQISGLDNLPDWDRPTVATDGRSVASILEDLVRPERMINFRLGITGTPAADDTDPPTIDAVHVVAFTHLESALSVPAFESLPANDDQVEFETELDPLTDTTVDSDDSDVVDQLIVRGPREIAVGTIDYEASAAWEADWTSADETAYADAASGDPGYATLDQDQQRSRNQHVRRSGKLRKVFRSFRLAKQWDGLTVLEDPFFRPIPAEDEMDDPTPYVPFLGNVEVLENLPLYQEIDYAGDVSSIDESDGRTPMQPLFLMEYPSGSTFATIEARQIGNMEFGFSVTEAAELPFNVSPEIDNDFGPRVLLDVSGGPQHAIAGNTFSGTDQDAPQTLYGPYDYKTLKTTVAMRGDRRREVRRPADDEVDGLDVVRRKLITLEDAALQEVHLAADTVVGVAADGTEVVSDGGLIRDPSDQLESIADLLETHYLSPRYRFELQTARRLDGVHVGTLVTTAEGHEEAINAPVVQVTVRSPMTLGDDAPEPPTMTLIAAATPADPLAFLRRDQLEPLQ
ncbi:hypothetical protein [Crateriforma conspicua]|uniref:Uncharacterized protein n=1 Tax=Crateriforma conspicua TaxID=2527996 RepID=A0A5C6FXT3_9PLAN|nr:hypothetical protein [Crateriforma conspicua]TWU66445.1 hypothetical protein V7x_20110 [Crateriforma conspicua]